MDDLQLGELIGTVKLIKENTDKIPDLAKLVAVHDSLLSTIIPKVDRHESRYQRIAGIVWLLTIVSGVLESYLWYKHG